MLTKSDFKQIGTIVQKNVQDVVRDEIGNETKGLKNSLESEIRMSRMRLQSSINELEDRFKNIEIGNNKTHKEITEIKKGVANIYKRLKFTSDILDKDNIRTLKRVRRIELHLKLPDIDYA